MFNVGDYVCCKEKNFYRMTDYGVKCKVLSIDGTYMNVAVVDNLGEHEPYSVLISNFIRWEDRNELRFEVGDMVIAINDRYTITTSRTPCKVVTNNGENFRVETIYPTQTSNPTTYPVDKDNFRMMSLYEIEEVRRGSYMVDRNEETEEPEEYITCEYCGRSVPEDEIYTTADDVNLCMDCWDEHAHCCYNCGDVYYYDREGTYDNCGDWYCNDCIDRGYGEFNYDNINGYHCGGEFTFLGNNDLRFGMEIEVSTSRICNLDSVAGDVWALGGELIYDIEEDCSIPNGFEIITNPMDYEYFNNKAKPTLNKIFDLLKDEGFDIRPSGCGTHIHISKEPLEVNDSYNADFNYLFEVFKDDIIHYGKRGSTHYAMFLSDLSRSYAEKLKKDKKNIKYRDVLDAANNNGDRYKAINNQNSNTLELRIFQSSIDINDIENYMKIAYYGAMSIIKSNFNNKTFKQIFHLDNISGNKTVNVDIEKFRIQMTKDNIIALKKNISEDIAVIVNRMSAELVEQIREQDTLHSRERNMSNFSNIVNKVTALIMNGFDTKWNSDKIDKIIETISEPSNLLTPFQGLVDKLKKLKELYEEL